jgi:tripartite-type tricarboxylate transporter receptor subunit TctC
MKSALRFTLLAAALAAAPGAYAQAPAYPTKPVQIIVPVLPGDTCDMIVRLVAAKMGEKLGQQFVAENRPGAGGMIGHGLVAKAQPDGYTLGCGSSGGMAVVPHAFKDASYNSVKDFTPIAMMARNFVALVVPVNSSSRTVADLVQRAKQNPGQLTFGSNGEGGYLHFVTERFRSAAGFTYLHVPFKGFPPVTIELMADRLDASFGSFPDVVPFMKDGRLRVLGIARPSRLAAYPDLPTIAETVPGYVTGGWFGIIAPAGVPRPIVTVLNREANAALNLPEIREKLGAMGLELPNETPEYFAKIVRDDFEVYGKIAKEIGLKPQ